MEEKLQEVSGKQGGYTLILGRGSSSLGPDLDLQFCSRGEGVINQSGDEPVYSTVSQERGLPGDASDEVGKALGAADVREKVVLHLAIFSGLRSGEMLAIQRRNVAPDGSFVEVEQRVYRGKLANPKNNKHRTVAVPPRTAVLLVEWLRTAVDPEPNAWVFASENRKTPLWRDNLLRRYVRPALEKVDLGWMDFKVMRRTNASLGHGAKIDPKVSADQPRGNGAGIEKFVLGGAEGIDAAVRDWRDSLRKRNVPERRLPM